MKLHENNTLFNNAIDYVVESSNISKDIVIKDYYVTLALKMLYANFDNIIFVGGTSLSKCFNIINRFSEDVDLAAIGNSKKGKQKSTEKVIDYFTDNWIFKVSHENLRISSNFKPLYLEYPNEYTGLLSNKVRLELLSFTEPFPTLIKEISALVNVILTEEEIKEYEMNSFAVKTQAPFRTLIEKVLLQKEIYKDFINGNTSPESARARARDFYDVHKILEYYNGDIPVGFEDFNSFIVSRNSNRINKTILEIKEINNFSLIEQFEKQNVAKQLIEDKSKLFIRDLDVNVIKNSLSKIDEFLINILKYKV